MLPSSLVFPFVFLFVKYDVTGSTTMELFTSTVLLLSSSWTQRVMGGFILTSTIPPFIAIVSICSNYVRRTERVIWSGGKVRENNIQV